MHKHIADVRAAPCESVKDALARWPLLARCSLVASSKFVGRAGVVARAVPCFFFKV